MSTTVTLTPVATCEAHLERAGVRVPAYKVGLCRDCFNGKAINPAIENVGRHPEPTLAKRDPRTELERALTFEALQRVLSMEGLRR